MTGMRTLTAFSSGNGKIEYSCASNFLFALMYSRYQLAKKFVHYYLHASNSKGHGVHSPFVFDFITHVLNDPATYPEYSQVETLRKKLRQDASLLRIQDLGAGSRTGHTQKSVSSIARQVVKSKKLAQLLFRIVRYYRSQTILEMGTSLGITSSYLALANPHSLLTTLEGSEEIAGVARKNFSALSLSNVQLITGNFDATLPKILEQTDTVDLAFIDGNHAKEPTLLYFKALLRKVKPSSIIIFDDIHWSKGMEEAWNAIKADPSVTLSIDLFFIGLVFFREDFKIKQHFTLRHSPGLQLL